MTVNFYVHKDDLDHLNYLLKADIFADSDYRIGVYRSPHDLNTTEIRNNFFLISINYEDFMRIEDFLIFQ